MKKELKGFVLGVCCTAILTGGVALAKSYSDYIEVTYDNIKVYKDNVLCELKDSNGSIIEPFIYNGTTYMPVRGTASLADMEVTWDGNTKSVYLWDEMVPDETYLVDVCPPYSGAKIYSAANSKTFKMSGNYYSNGFTIHRGGGNVLRHEALINLNGKYKTLTCEIGSIDSVEQDKHVMFIADDKIIEQVEVKGDGLPQKIVIPLNYANSLKVGVDKNSGYGWVGLANIIVK